MNIADAMAEKDGWSQGEQAEFEVMAMGELAGGSRGNLRVNVDDHGLIVMTNFQHARQRAEEEYDDEEEAPGLGHDGQDIELAEGYLKSVNTRAAKFVVRLRTASVPSLHLRFVARRSLSLSTPPLPSARADSAGAIGEAWTARLR